MGTFTVAYLAVWLAVVLYVGRLGARQRQLTQDLRSLQGRLDASAQQEKPTPKAA